MQENKKKTLLNALAKTNKKLRGDRSQYIHGAEYSIPTSVLSDIERGEKDPQYTTLFKMANSFGLKFSEYAKEIEKELPNDFSFYDE